MNREIYERNKKAMEKRFPGMSGLVEEKRKENQKEDLRVTVERAVDDAPVLILERGGRKLYVSGRRYPQKTAERVIDRWGGLNRASAVAVFGMGDTAFLAKLLENTKKEVSVMVYEPSFLIFLTLLENVDITAYFENRPIGLVVRGLNEEELPQILNAFIQLSNMEFLKRYENASYLEMFQEQALWYMRKLDRHCKSIIANGNTWVRYSPVEADNVFHNIKYLCDGSATVQLCDVIPRDIPAIVVSAGPSLNKNIRELRKAKNRAFIVAVDTAVKPMVKAGIIPDLYVIVDGLKPLELFEFEEAERIPLMCSLSSAKSVMEHHKGKKIFWFEGQSFIWSLMCMTGAFFPKVACGGSVACSAFSLVYKMGFSRIILVGQDLAMTGNKTHADGTFQEKMDEIDTSRCMTVEGNCEEKVPTRTDFKLYLDWFNYYIEEGRGVHVMNATEGGAKIRNTEIISLKDAIERECKKEVDIGACMEKLEPLFGREQRETAVKYLNSVPGEYRNIKKKVKSLHACYKKLEAICKSGNIEKNEYLKTLKRIKKLTGQIESHELYEMIENTLSVANYILRSEQFYEEDSLEAEGREIARKGKQYTQKIEQCIDLLIPLAEETVGKLR